jgi:hypothetical protein
VKVTLKKGTFMIDVTAMNKAINSQQDPQVGSHATCSAAFSGSAPVTFLNGRGLYKGHGNRTIHPCDPTQPATCRRSLSGTICCVRGSSMESPSGPDFIPPG